MRAVCVGGECSERITNGEVQLTYMSPETILTCPTWREMFQNHYFQDNLVCMDVDEAHLIEKWCVCVTTTATRKLVIQSLEMHGFYIKSKNPNRRNMHTVHGCRKI